MKPHGAMLYDYAWIHQLMVLDRPRCEAYRQAILETVRPGQVVLDFGAGSGLLSLFALQAGARKVYAVERAAIAETAERIVAANGGAGVVEVIRAGIEEAELPEPVDAIVSEWLGGYGVDEDMFAPLLAARDRWLKPGGAMLPVTVTAFLAPVFDEQLGDAVGFLRGRPYDLDLNLLADGTVEEVRYAMHHVLPDHLLAPPQAMWSTDSLTCTQERARRPFTARMRFTAERRGALNALAAWFSADFGGGIGLSNAPEAPATHWGRTVFPLSRSREAMPGTAIEVAFTFTPGRSGDSSLSSGWSARIGDGPWEHHGNHRAAGGPRPSSAEAL